MMPDEVYHAWCTGVVMVKFPYPVGFTQKLLREQRRPIGDGFFRVFIYPVYEETFRVSLSLLACII